MDYSEIIKHSPLYKKIAEKSQDLANRLKINEIGEYYIAKQELLLVINRGVTPFSEIRKQAWFRRALRDSAKPRNKKD